MNELAAAERSLLCMMVEWPHHPKFWRELLESAKDAGIATLGVAILFGLSVGVALIFHYL
jgi:ABC-type transporter Mla maintaining outer membrane lipid asymmetry permease subunit MlaE